MSKIQKILRADGTTKTVHYMTAAEASTLARKKAKLFGKIPFSRMAK